MITAPEILVNAGRHILQRGQQHDDQGSSERNMARTVRVFNELTGRSLSTEEGWIFMVCLKLVRTRTATEPNPDSYEDGAAYFALAGEEALNDQVSNSHPDKIS